ncbi:MAG TPA: hypothetical protein VFA45_02920 [Actinomycetes bacterium]|nr:hypothetical protein [Actinomycetes bacterium]
MSSNRFDPLDENEREWLRSSRRARARRAWVTVFGIAIVLALLVWLVIILLTSGGGGGGNASARTTVEDRVLADSRTALRDWGRFGVSGDLNAVKTSFWPQGPQYKQLSKEAPRLRQHPLGPPAYQFVLTGTPRVLPAGGNQRIVRGVVTTSRPGQPTRSFRWDIYLRADPGAGGRWRVWTVANTPRG